MFVLGECPARHQRQGSRHELTGTKDLHWFPLRRRPAILSRSRRAGTGNSLSALRRSRLLLAADGALNTNHHARGEKGERQQEEAVVERPQQRLRTDALVQHGERRALGIEGRAPGPVLEQRPLLCGERAVRGPRGW